MRKTIKAAAILAAAVIGIAVVGAAPATAAQGQWSGIDMPSQVYYPASGSCLYVPISVGISTDMWDGEDFDSWDVTLTVDGISNPGAWGAFDYDSESIRDGSGNLNFREYMCLGTDSIGKFVATAEVTAYDADYNVLGSETDTFNFWIGTWGSLSLNAGPEPVRKGSTITVAGYFRLAHGSGDGLPNRTIHIWRALPGSTHWYEVATDRTDSHGKYVVKVKATKTYKWKATYEPTASQAHLLHGKASFSDSVKVK